MESLLIIKPFLALLKSQKFWISVATLIVDALILYAPEFDAVQVELVVAVSSVGFVLATTRWYERFRAGTAGNPDDVPAVVGPLMDLLRSRKFVLGAVTVIVDVLIVLLPELEADRVSLMAVFTAFMNTLIGLIAVEDGQRKARIFQAATAQG